MNVLNRICDFGLVHARAESERHSKVLAASFRWTAPEVLSGSSLPTTASDVYSLGILLWELVTAKVSGSRVAST